MCSLFLFKDQTSFFEFTPIIGLYPQFSSSAIIIDSWIKHLHEAPILENKRQSAKPHISHAPTSHAPTSHAPASHASISHAPTSHASTSPAHASHAPALQHRRKVALVNDISGYGHCSTAVALSVISWLGIQCCPVPYCHTIKPHRLQQLLVR